MKLSTVIIDYRNRMQISQREFARRCGLSNSYISFIENEYNPRTGKPIIPTLEQYHKIASCMGMSVHHLFELLDEDSPVDLRESSLSEPSAPKTFQSRIVIPDNKLFIQAIEKMSLEDLANLTGIFYRAFEKLKKES